MFYELGEYELDILNYSINFLRMLKYVRMRGFTIGAFSPTIDFANEYSASSETDFDKCAHDLLEIIFETNIQVVRVEEEADSDREEDMKNYLDDIGSTMEATIEYQILVPINQSDVLKYIGNIKKDKYCRDEFNRKISDIFEVSQSENYFEIFLTKSYDKVYICSSTYEFLDMDFLDNLFELIDFCKEENIKKEVPKCQDLI